MKKIALYLLSIILLLGVGYLIFSNKKVEKLHASWEYNYTSLNELTQDAGHIAYIKLLDNGKSQMEENIPITYYNAKIVDSIDGLLNENIKIIMTGGDIDNTIYEIEDDPLMKQGEEYLVFLKKNDTGTYRIIGGPQGRFLIENNKVSSLNHAFQDVKNTLDISKKDYKQLYKELKKMYKNKKK